MPAVAAEQVPGVLARFPGARTAKVKVAEPGQTLADDVARVAAVRAQVPTCGSTPTAAGRSQEAVAAAAALTAGGPLEYLEQPCRTVGELAELRRRVDVPIAADESIRKAADPLRVVRARAADIAVLKVAPLGGVAALLDIAARIDIPVVISSALDSAVGISRGLLAAAALPELTHACGLGTGGLFTDDVCDARRPSTAACRWGRRRRTRRDWRRWRPDRPGGTGGSSGCARATRCSPADRHEHSPGAISSTGHRPVVTPKATMSAPAGSSVCKRLSIAPMSSTWMKLHSTPMIR